MIASKGAWVATRSPTPIFPARSKSICRVNALHSQAGVVALKGFGLDPPFPRLLQAILMLWGMPRAVKRLMQRTATAASVCWRSKLRERRLGPISVL
jgi:hypothetical protein